MTKRTYKKLGLIGCHFEVIKLAFAGGPVWYKDKPLNAEFILNMRVRDIIKGVESGNYFYCERVEK